MRRRHVFLPMYSSGWQQQIGEGIRRYAREHTDWAMMPVHPSDPLPMDMLTAGCGLIGQINEAIAARLAPGTPAVSVTMRDRGPLASRIPCVTCDDRQAGRLAADHLLQIGCRSFVFVGHVHIISAAMRLEGYQGELQRHGRDCDVVPRSRLWYTTIADKLAQMPHPVGVYTEIDSSGGRVVWACDFAGLRVPEQVAVLGTDNDLHTVQWTHPPMSSVNIPAMQVGYRAAELLDRQFRGEAVSSDPIMLPAGPVVQRGTTELTCVEDPHVASALRFIREYAGEGIVVEDVVDVVPVCRRRLEQKFRRYVNRTPHQEIQRVRLQRAQELLMETDCTIAQIAERLGYASAEYMATAFSRRFGCAPTEWRKRTQR